MQAGVLHDGWPTIKSEDPSAPSTKLESVLSNSVVQVAGKTAVLSYTRTKGEDSYFETRVWTLGSDGLWKQGHYHRSFGALLDDSSASGRISDMFRNAI